MRKKEQIEVVNRINVSMFLLIFIFIIEISSGGVVEPIQQQLSRHGNFLKVLNIYNGEIATFFNIENDVAVYQPNRQVIEDGDDLKIYEDTVTSDTTGVVVSISSDDTGNIVLVKALDDREYEYRYIDTVSVTLYDYVSVGDVIGNGVKGDYYKLSIKNI
ncbi:hypothetical protein RJG79_06190 [Mycoplasmatota bacterium WC44]